MGLTAQHRRLLITVSFVVVAAAASLVLVLRPRSSGTGGLVVALSSPCDVFPELDGALTSWMEGWRRISPGLTCEHFERVKQPVLPVRPPRPAPQVESIAAGVAARLRSPNGSQLLLPVVGPGPRSELRLVDLAAGTERVLFSAEDGTTWQDAGWIHERQLVVGGHAPGGAPGTLWPSLTVIRLDENRADVYRGPIVAEERWATQPHADVPPRDPA